MPPRPNVKVVGRRLDPGDYRLRDFLTRAAQPHEVYEAGTPEADAVLAAAGANGAELPVVFDDDTFYAGATVQKLAEAWSVFARPKSTHYDLFIVGGGPAGLAAAVYGASDGLSTAVAEADVPGGQASYTSMIENFFGFVERIGGPELARLAGRQAERRRPQRGGPVRRRARDGRGRRQLRGPGRHEPGERGRVRDDGRARRQPLEVDVRVSRGAGRGE
jgi:thioredoxin reductase (NADPH)